MSRKEPFHNQEPGVAYPMGVGEPDKEKQTQLDVEVATGEFLRLLIDSNKQRASFKRDYVMERRNEETLEQLATAITPSKETILYDIKIGVLTAEKTRQLHKKMRDWDSYVEENVNVDRSGKVLPFANEQIKALYLETRKHFMSETLELGAQLIEVAANVLGINKDISDQEIDEYIERASDLEEDEQRDMAADFKNLRSLVTSFSLLDTLPQYEKNIMLAKWRGNPNPLRLIFEQWQRIWTRALLTHVTEETAQLQKRDAGKWIGNLGTGESPFKKLVGKDMLRYRN